MTGKAAIVSKRSNYPLLLGSQFLSAFGDNFIVMLILGPLLVEFARGKITAMDQSVANIFYTSLIMVPYPLLAPLTGYVNDRYSKNRWLTGGNLFKVLGTLVAMASLVSSPYLLAVGYFIVGIGAAVYSPAKYGILPEILPVEELVKANGMMELLTLVAILTGNIAGALAFDNLNLTVCYLILIGIYLLSLGMNALMSRTPSYPEVMFKDSAGAFFHNVRALVGERRLALVLLGTSLFWLCGAVLKMNFEPWGQQVLHLTSMTQISLLGLWLALGVMAGSVLAGQLYRIGDIHATRRFGWLLSGGIACLSLVGWISARVLNHPKSIAIVMLLLTGLMAGLFLIPLNAALQAESHKDKLGKTIATQNGFENLAMLGGSVIAYLNVKKGFNPSELLFVLAAFVAVITFFLKIPEKKSGEQNSAKTH